MSRARSRTGSTWAPPGRCFAAPAARPIRHADTMAATDLAVVVIGRNEGERLRRCFMSVCRAGTPVVYVDSGSTDGSIALAHAMQVDVVELDLRMPFTAARARNAGWQRVQQVAPAASLVQFVDGDCEIWPGWLAIAERHLATHAEIGVVAGRLRERFPERSIYNRLCQI